MPKRTIEQMVADKYDDEEVSQHILESLHKDGTAERVLRGELVLPSVQDATRHYQIASGKYASTPEGQQQLDRLAALEKEVQTLKAGKETAKGKGGK